MFGIFENVSFLNEGILGNFVKSEIYMIAYDKYDKIYHPSGCKTAKGIINIMLSNEYEYKNGKYIIDSIDDCNLFLYKCLCKDANVKLVNTQTGKVEYLDSKKPIKQELVKEFKSIKDLASYAGIGVQYIGPNKDTKDAIKIAKDIISKSKLPYIDNKAFRRINVFKSIEDDIKQFQDSTRHTCFLVGIGLYNLDILDKDADKANKIAEKVDKCVEEINKKLKEKKYDIVAKSEWVKYDGYIYLADKRANVGLGWAQTDGGYLMILSNN